MAYRKTHRVLFTFHMAAIAGLVVAMAPTELPEFFRIILPGLFCSVLLVGNMARHILKLAFKRVAKHFWQILLRIGLCVVVWWIFWLLLRVGFHALSAQGVDLSLAGSLTASIWAAYGLTSAAITLLALACTPAARGTLAHLRGRPKGMLAH
ncbi:hypothetical protein [Amantichitinum ursilacus]|uniref:Transmembrane protein n=1 Tax=Amantichitinum ursilacus TaxID=857265 RepID=A0A0N0XL86_9NEIS|nr:hypothetical protein [Amantichitinum ursilacus]KPC55267.1 hypothetical protein WG78_01375 [Amantichitinum ursilacus]